VQEDLSSLTRFYIELIEDHSSSHKNADKLTHVVGDNLQKFVNLRPNIVSDGLRLNELGPLFDLLVLVFDVGFDEPLSELLHQLSERVMLELIVLVKGQELAAVLL
jgi:hypothetical protein